MGFAPERLVDDLRYDIDAFHVIGRRASNPRSKRHELGLYRVSDIASFLLPGE